MRRVTEIKPRSLTMTGSRMLKTWLPRNFLLEKVLHQNAKNSFQSCFRIVKIFHFLKIKRKLLYIQLDIKIYNMIFTMMACLLSISFTTKSKNIVLTIDNIVLSKGLHINRVQCRFIASKTMLQ